MAEKNIASLLANELGIKVSQVEATIKLIDEGNTIPFIARYRKEVTGALNDEILRTLDERLTYLRNLEDRRSAILNSIEEQGKLDDELRAKIEAAVTMVALEDLYLPYKPKKRTRATIAKEKGLEPLAEIILAQEKSTIPSNEAENFIDEEKEVNTIDDAIAGEVREISSLTTGRWRMYLGSVLAAGSFSVFFGGSLLDGGVAALFALLICALQEKLLPISMNQLSFNLLCSVIVGVLTGLCANFIPVLHLDKIMIGYIMLLIPGMAMTNAVRNVLGGNTISGVMRLIEAVLWAAALALGFMIAMFITGGGLHH